MSRLLDNISQVIQLNSEEKIEIDAAFQAVPIKRGDYWIEEGRVCNQVAFLESGRLRVYYGDPSGDEVTCHFFMPDVFVSSFTSFLTNTPTNENIVAIEDSTLRVISKTVLEKLSETIPGLHIWRRVIAENLFIAMEKRIAMLQSRTAFERYEKMIKEDPAIILTIPLQYTASFLGITPQHLSRLRKELTK